MGEYPPFYGRRLPPFREADAPFFNRSNPAVALDAPALTDDWLAVEGVGSLPTLAIDFTRSKAYGATLGSMISTLSGVVAGQGLGYSPAGEVQIIGALRTAIQGATGTLFVETGPPTGGNFADVVGGPSVGLIGRGGSGVVTQSWNGSAALAVAPDGSQGQNTDSTVAMAALRWSPAGRGLSAGGSAITGDTGGPGIRPSLYVGRRGDGSSAGSGWIRAFFLWSTALSAAEMAALTFCSVASRALFSIYGDSMSAGSGAFSVPDSSWWALLNAELNANVPARGSSRYMNQQGVGGSTSGQARAAFGADTVARNRINIFWTGHNAPNAAQTLADLQAMAAAVTGDRRFLVLLPVQNSGNAPGSAGFNEIVATRNAIRGAFPAANVLDIPAALAAAGNGGSDNAQVAAGFTPPSLLSDTIHLNDAGQAVVKAAVKARLGANGWV